MDNNLEELSDFVQENPDDYNQRWRLAKKLYSAWEYRAALEHLLALKEAWPNQQNVIHYLATTYYRMGNYQDAIAELEALLEIYPSDTSVRRLLARICESSGERSKAAEVYKEIYHHSPSPSVEAHVGRLDAELNANSTSPGAPPVDDAVDKTQVTCRFCDSPNDFFNERCWQCHASLDPEEQRKAGEARAVREGSESGDGGGHTVKIVVLSIVLIAAIGAVIYFVI